MRSGGGVETGIGMRRLIVGIFCCLVLAASPAVSAELATYKLQRGDTVSLRVLGLADLAVDSMIDVDGMIVLPYVGALDAENKTLLELREIVATALNGRTYRYLTREGLDGLITIGRDDVQLSVAQYRPVTVYGAVPNPGEIPFRAGMTVRAAVARAGSVRPVFDDGTATGATSLRASQLEGEIRALTVQRDHEVAVGWRLRQELQRLGAEKSEPGKLPEGIAERWEGQQVALLERQMDATNGQLDQLNKAIDSVDRRMEYLAEREKAEAGILNEDTEEMAKMEALLKKGIVSNQRASDVRRLQLLSATRLLQTQDSTARSEMERLTLQAQVDRQVSDRVIVVMQQVEASDVNLSVLNSRITALQQQLAMLGVSVMDTNQALVVRIHRSSGAGVEEILATMDDLVSPGDILEVSFEALRN